MTNFSALVTLMGEIPDILATLPDIVIEIVVVGAFLAVGGMITGLLMMIPKWVGKRL